MSQRPIITFAFAGLVSGVCCSLPLFDETLVAGWFFGVALLLAIHTCVQPLRLWQAIALVTGADFAYWVAMVTGGAAWENVDIENEFLNDTYVGALGGLAGALVLSLFITLVCQRLRTFSFVLFTVLAGCQLGAFFNTTHFVLPYTNLMGIEVNALIAYVMWQVGASITIGAYAKFSGATSETKAGMNSHRGTPQASDDSS